MISLKFWLSWHLLRDDICCAGSRNAGQLTLMMGYVLLIIRNSMHIKFHSHVS